jgi:hypothetical protein
MGISFKLSKVGVRLHPAARSATAAPAKPAGANKSAASEKEGSVSEPRREVRLASVVCSIDFLIPPGDSEGRVGGGGDLGAQRLELFLRE